MLVYHAGWVMIVLVIPALSLHFRVVPSGVAAPARRIAPHGAWTACAIARGLSPAMSAEITTIWLETGLVIAVCSKTASLLILSTVDLPRHHYTDQSSLSEEEPYPYCPW